MKQFVRNQQYKLYRKNGDIAERIAVCTGINRKLNKIRFKIMGSDLESNRTVKVVILNLKIDELNSTECASSFDFKEYLTIYATDEV